MSEFITQATSIFERRFLKNAFLPVLVFFPAILAPTLLFQGRLLTLVHKWDSQATTLKIIETAGFLVVIWFISAIVASQWRNIIRLYEGYPLAGWPILDRLGKEWHEKQRMKLDRIKPKTTTSQFLTYWSYPAPEHILPTRLGNVLRAAEMYPLYRYGADEILLWPRIYHVLPRELLSDIEDARASLEFLLVVSLWCVGFAIGNPVVAVLDHGSASLASWMFVIGIFSGYLAYSSAIPAAAEYGEYLRSAFEAYRFNLLAQLRAPAPEDLTAERRLWNGLGAFLLNGAYLAWRYETDGNERLTRSEDLQSYHGGEGA